ncbi:MAG TPA: DsbA family protein [Stellaceae bacterium]|nr:DsbA family protein [Stellaceae bacterium]
MPLHNHLRSALALGVLAIYALGTTPQARAADDAKLDQHIHDYIIAHPEVIVEALQKAQAQAEAQQASDAQVALHAKQKQLLNDPASPVMGNPKGDVTLVEFFDYRCPYCKIDAPNVQAAIQADPKLRVVMKEFPILGPDSVFAAKVALVAAKHGKYAEFHNAMFAAKGQIDESKIMDVAHSVGLDPKKTRAEMNDPAIEKQIQDNLELAKAVGVEGTPAFVAGDTLLPGAVSPEDLHKLVAQARAKG